MSPEYSLNVHFNFTLTITSTQNKQTLETMHFSVRRYDFARAVCNVRVPHSSPMYEVVNIFCVKASGSLGITPVLTVFPFSSSNCQDLSNSHLKSCGQGWKKTTTFCSMMLFKFTMRGELQEVLIWSCAHTLKDRHNAFWNQQT